MRRTLQKCLFFLMKEMSHLKINIILRRKKSPIPAFIEEQEVIFNSSFGSVSASISNNKLINHFSYSKNLLLLLSSSSRSTVVGFVGEPGRPSLMLSYVSGTKLPILEDYSQCKLQVLL